MKKSIIALLGAVMATATLMAAPLTDDDRAIKYEQLPAKARTFIADHFPNVQPSYTFEDREHDRSEYKVLLESGAKIEFDGTESGAMLSVMVAPCPRLSCQRRLPTMWLSTTQRV